MLNRGLGVLASCLGLLALVTGLVGSTSAAPVPKVQKQPTEQEVRAKVFGTCWYESDKIVAGKSRPNHNYEEFGWKFTKEGAESWELGGEMSLGGYDGGIKINASVEPWRMDIFSKENGEMSVLPTIFKFDGDDIIWATRFPGDGWNSIIDSEGNYKGRPTGFESTEKNRYKVCRLKPCAYYQTEFPKDK